ncbi:ribosome maturation factor RimM [Dysgonomonas sp. 25]|uniref:ribosome maturation factor RimM n=1 Tax=Dysgonomonas sp. 25 TaxID=2302933 RepID=UPI0013D4300B|nr:ribosome maturation factor RimM [Dysgonomonas sp. 25]NDV67428.1 16S rRNA processing protein RimM [Dysgonomonas sp. 25]
MIRESEVFKIGKFTKPHGVKGEIAFSFENDVFDRVDCPYLVCQIDGIFVPFFIEEYRFKGKETALITFEDVDSEEKAQRFSGLDVYFPRSYVAEEDIHPEDSWNYFIGFTVVDKTKGQLGTITSVDTATINTLFVVEGGDEEYLIPAVEEFITQMDSAKKILRVSLPEGLIE